MLEGQVIVSELGPQQFRGEFLDCFAAIEDYLSPCLDRLIYLGVSKKLPHLFGQKFGLAVRHVSQEELWRNPSHMEKVLLAIQPYADLRGLICHAIIEKAVIGVKPAITLRPPGSSDWPERKILTLSEAKSMLKDLRLLVKKLKRQELLQV